MFPLIFLLLILPIYPQSTYIQFEKSKEDIVIDYLKFCKKGSLLDLPKEDSEEPKITIVIPMYNEAKHLTMALRTVQNQSLRDIEIICVDDKSTDETKELLKKYAEEDPRIRIIRNKKNRGVLYNRIYGALQATGDYVAFLDADDALAQMNLFKNLYEKAKKLDFPEIIHFHSCGSNYDGNLKFEHMYLFNIFNPRVFGKVFYQPEIKDNYMQGHKHITGSGLVYDKLYSRKLIKRMANFIGEDLWNQHLVYIDDYLMAFAAMRVCKSIVMIDEIGYWHWFDNNLSMTSSVFEVQGYNLKNPKKSNKKILDYILIKERMFDLTEDDPNSEEFRVGALRDLETDEFMDGLGRSIHFDRLLAIYERFINWKFISKKTRSDTIEGMKKLLNHYINVKDKYKMVVKDEDDVEKDL